MVVNQLLKYGEFGIVLFDNFQVTERTRNLVGRESAARVQISDPPPMRFQAAQKKPQDIGVLRLFTNLEGYKELLI